MVDDMVLEAMRRIAVVRGHQHPRVTLQKSHSQVFFLEGHPNVGKKESVLEWIRFLTCPHASQGTPCNVCESCLKHFFFRSNDVFWCSLENTLDYVGFLLKEYQRWLQNLQNPHNLENFEEKLKEKQQHLWGIRLQIRREIMRILSLHRSGVFPLLRAQKKSFAQGVVLDEQKLSQFLTQAKKWLDSEWFFSADTTKGEKNDFCDGHRAYVFEVISALHHCFDRSMIVKEVLNKMLHFCWRQRDGDNPCFVFIDPIEKIHPHLVSSLLKTLEEPPRNVYFFLFSDLATSMSEQVLKPLLSRVIRLRFSRLPKEEMMSIAQKKWIFVEDPQQRQFLKTSLDFCGQNLDFSLFFQQINSLYAVCAQNDFADATAKIFSEHEKLKHRGGFKKDLQIGLLLSDFSSSKDSLPDISLRRLLDETKYAIHLFLESRIMGKKLNFSLPFYMHKKKVTDCKIFLHEIAKLEFLLEKNTLGKESIFFKWLLLLQ